MDKFNTLVESVLSEARKPFDPSPYNTERGKKPVTFIGGRFQPWTRGHQTMIDNAKNPVVVGIVKGKNSSKDKERNPFPFDVQAEIIKAAGGNKVVDVIEIPFMNYVQIVSDLREKGLEVTEVMSGDDRLKEYQRFIDKYSEPMNWDINVRADATERTEGISGTAARQALRNDDYEGVKKVMKNVSPTLYKKLRKFV